MNSSSENGDLFATQSYRLLLSSHVKKCYSVNFMGRLGNLMFMYGALVGICLKHNMIVEECAIIRKKYLEMSDERNPMKRFISIFNLTWLEEKNSICHLTGRNVATPTKFYNEVFNVQSGAEFNGYMQSWRYFHPHAYPELKKYFILPNFALMKSQALYESYQHKVIQRLGISPSSLLTVGVHVRLGDKLSISYIYPPWPLSLDYSRTAIQMIERRYSEQYNILYIFMYGGSFKHEEEERDRQFMITNVQNISKNYQLVQGESDLVSMGILQQCDVLVISASSFSWWAAYLGKAKAVYAPKRIIVESYGFVPEDYYLPDWILLEEPNLKK